MLFLALAADRHGASFYGRDKMALLVGLERTAVDRALGRLLDLDLVVHKPWRPGQPDGVWQILPVPLPPRRDTGTEAIGSVLGRLDLRS